MDGDQRAAGVGHAGGGLQHAIDGLLADAGGQARLETRARHGGDQVAHQGQGGVHGLFGGEQAAGQLLCDDATFHVMVSPAPEWRIAERMTGARRPCGVQPEGQP
jgi:hypothetical protein